MAGVHPIGFRVGSVLSRSLAILGRNVVPFGLLSLAITSPALLYEIFVLGDRAPSAQSLPVLIPYFAITIVLGAVLTATITYRTIAELRGTRSDFSYSLRQGGALAIPVIGVALVIGLLAMLGMIAFVVPGFIVLTRLWAAVPAAVVERCGIRASLERSQELTAGHRWRVFAIILIFAAIGYAVEASIQGVLGSDTALSDVVVFVATAFASAWEAVANAVGYHDLRLLKEGEPSA